MTEWGDASGVVVSRVCLRTALLVGIVLLHPAMSRAQAKAEVPPDSEDADTIVQHQQDDLTRLSLEELAMVEVTSVSRRPEPLAGAAAAIYVITDEDVRRSGATSVPEVLRLAPNLNVQRVNAVDYAISARGFNGFETSNKLLVLVDGRSVYSTLSSGVFWDGRDLLLEDIARIEVISGPGGALYGANAVNGVINIITKSASQTLGTLISAHAGSEDLTLALRHGGTLGSNGTWRAYVNGFRRDDSFDFDGSDAADAASGVRGGGRVDWNVADSLLTLQGDVFENTIAVNEDSLGTQTSVFGGNLLGRWSRPFLGGELQVQGYYDRFVRTEPGTRESGDTYDALVQQTLTWGRHNFVLGAGYRTVESRFTAPAGGAVLDPASRTLTLTNLFAQDQITLQPGLVLTLGAKVEDNSFTGQEFLPNARIAWSRPGGDLVWAAVSRASRTPNRIERDLSLPGFLEPGVFRSESLTAYEAGYRARPTPALSVSVSVFFNDYDHLRTVSTTPATFLPLRLDNLGRGTTWGVEAWGSYDVTPDWRLSAGLITLEKDFEATGIDISNLASTGNDPEAQLIARSQSALTERLDLDVQLRAVDDLAAVDGYVDADVRLGWRVNDAVEFAVTGQNLLHERRAETADPARARLFGRSLTASLRLAF